MGDLDGWEDLDFDEDENDGSRDEDFISQPNGDRRYDPQSVRAIIGQTGELQALYWVTEFINDNFLPFKAVLQWDQTVGDPLQSRINDNVVEGDILIKDMDTGDTVLGIEVKTTDKPWFPHSVTYSNNGNIQRSKAKLLIGVVLNENLECVNKWSQTMDTVIKNIDDRGDFFIVKGRFPLDLKKNLLPFLQKEPKKEKEDDLLGRIDSEVVAGLLRRSCRLKVEGEIDDPITIICNSIEPKLANKIIERLKRCPT